MKMTAPIFSGWGVFIISWPIIVIIARIVGLEFSSFLWPSILAGFLAGLFAGHISQERPVLVGALAACPLIIIIALTALFTGLEDIPNFADVENASWGSVLLAPVFGAIGGWVGANWLPGSKLSEWQSSKSVGSWKTIIGILLGFGLGVLLLNIPGFPLYLFMAGIAIASFASAGYYWASKPGDIQNKKYRVVVFTIFGLMSAAMAIYLWFSPLPEIPWTQSLSLLIGALLGALILWFGSKDKKNKMN